MMCRISGGSWERVPNPADGLSSIPIVLKKCSRWDWLDALVGVVEDCSVSTMILAMVEFCSISGCCEQEEF